MPRGGARSGAGRPKGAVTRRTREIADQAMAEGITPLEVMLENMRAYHAAGERKEAQECAKDAAPYIHPRIQSSVADDDADHEMVIHIHGGLPDKNQNGS